MLSRMCQEAVSVTTMRITIGGVSAALFVAGGSSQYGRIIITASLGVSPYVAMSIAVHLMTFSQRRVLADLDGVNSEG
jgi:phosphate/sulfate permease